MIHDDLFEDHHRHLKGGRGGGSSGGGSRGWSSSSSSGRWNIGINLWLVIFGSPPAASSGRYGGCYGCYSTRNSSGTKTCYDENDRVIECPSNGATIAIVFGVLGAIGILYLAYGIWKQRDNNNNSNKAGDFDTSVSQAKEKAASNAAIVGESGRRFETCSGDYDLTYEDKGKILKGQMSIQLTNNPQLNGYTITGVNVDEDGASNVTDGFVHYTGEAWWVDEVEAGQVGAGTSNC